MAVPLWRQRAKGEATSRYNFYRRYGPSRFYQRYKERYRGYSYDLNKLNQKHYKASLKPKEPKIPETVHVRDIMPNSETYGQLISIPTKGYDTADKAKADYQKTQAVELGKYQAAEKKKKDQQETFARLKKEAEEKRKAKEAANVEAFLADPDTQEILDARYRGRQLDAENLRKVEELAAKRKADPLYWYSVPEAEKKKITSILDKFTATMAAITKEINENVSPDVLKYQTAFGDEWEGGLDYFYIRGTRTDRNTWEDIEATGKGYKDIEGKVLGGAFDLKTTYPMLDLLADYRVGDIHKEGYYKKLFEIMQDEGHPVDSDGNVVNLQWVKNSQPDPDDPVLSKGYAEMGKAMYVLNPLHGLSQIEEMNKKFSQVIESGALQEGISSSIKTVLDPVVTTLEELPEKIEETKTVISDTVAEVTEVLKDPIKLAEVVKEPAIATIEKTKKQFVAKVEETKTAAVEYIERPSKIIEDVVETLDEVYQESDLDKFLEDPVEYYEGSTLDQFFEEPIKTMNDAKDALDEKRMELEDYFNEKGEQIKDAILSTGQKAKEEGTETIERVGEDVGEKFEQVKKYTKEKGEEVKTFVTEDVPDFVEDVYETGKDVVEVITDPGGTIEKVKAGIQDKKDVLGSELEKGKKNLQKSLDDISDTGNTVRNMIKDLVTNLNTGLGEVVSGMDLTGPLGPKDPGAEDLNFAAAMAGQGGDPQLATLRKRFKKSRKRGKAKLRKGGGLYVPYESGIQIPV